jgi:hypothetical protein
LLASSLRAWLFWAEKRATASDKMRHFNIDAYSSRSFSVLMRDLPWLDSVLIDR